MFRGIVVSRDKKGIKMYIEMIENIGRATYKEAKQIEHQMQCNGFDFSEATNLQFKSGILDAQIDLGLQAFDEDALEALYRSL